MTSDLDFDLVVVGATPGGIACAIRAAREGLKVLMTCHYGHVGGMLSNGLGCLDTQYSGMRSPLHAEFCDRLLSYYREGYGRDSEQYRSCFIKVWPEGADVPKPLPERFRGRLTLESFVAESIFNQMLKAEPNLTLWRWCYPLEVEREGACVRGLTLHFPGSGENRRVRAQTYADCTYEGDLLALAGADYRVGRESRADFNEAHAGRIFMAVHFAGEGEGGYPRDAAEGRLNLHPYEVVSQEVFAGSTGEGDRKVQAYTFRLTLTDEPSNRLMPERPPRYDRDIYVRMRNRWGLGGRIPNGKLHWNTSNLPGGNWSYPEADWEARAEITRRHLDHAIGFLWFLQNDEAVPVQLREKAQRYGLARDEYTDNAHVPWEMYVREARRLVGRSVFTEHDGTIGPGLCRAPVHDDSIAVTEWGMDSHSVSEEMVPGSRREGKLLLTELSRPGQVPYRCLLPRDLDNLLVPVCLSATHVGWGAIRLEPTWMHIGESAGAAAALSQVTQTPVGNISVDALQRKLVESGVMISFFNEFDMDSKARWAGAVQYFGAKGFFASYDALPESPLDEKTANVWISIVAARLTEPPTHAAPVRWAERYPAPGSTGPVSSEAFRHSLTSAFQGSPRLLEVIESHWPEHKTGVCEWTRGEACLFFYDLAGFA